MDYIFPNPNEKICIVKCKDPIDNIHIGEKLSKSSPLYKKIISELEFPFHQSVIKLSQCTRNLMKDTFGPNVLFLSNNAGGFAKCGLNLIEETKSIDYPHLNYVDLFIDEELLNDGSLEIFSHELGHVMMANILKNFPSSNSSKQHLSMGITDYFMAFNEGWAVHFERLTYDFITHYKEIHNLKYNYDRDICRLWQCESDCELRLNGVIDNIYIHNKLLPTTDKLKLNISDTIILEHTSTIFDKTKLKSAQEMLSCEGVIATLFYRISTNKILQNNYLSEDFYNNFLISNINDRSNIKELFTPFENIILKTFWIWYKIKDSLNENSIPFIEFIKMWCECFPQDKQELLKLFISTTVGKTISNDLSDIYEKAAYNGMIGNMQVLIEAINEYKKTFDNLCKMIENGDIAIDENIGKEIWIENTHVKIPKYFWLNEEMIPLKVNLNTASLYDLISFPKITLAKATEILNNRTKKGYYKDVEEVGLDYFI
ncbi:helix-hairpin-helix domain-containing protein [Sedimentibacter sp. zth1]|uniref:ComEA family DNA-binding protein n=1 Tax=Sedimentibacter sp. zth1 TaxID=2816908 RepID=UPI001A934206|nr:helix-hairpin-helix domain-containing protein [Sedimentibacter sp. zth1]QSX05670.1 helix-hairpin-helix domain-containing protein [Sedimentibacter sp. zth1]